MKKLLLSMLLVTLTLTISSCSSEDAPEPVPVPVPVNTVSLKVDGTLKVFNTVQVVQEPFTIDGVEYVDLKVTASENGSETNYIIFYVAKGALGPDVSWGYFYVENDMYYEENAEASVSTIVTTNSDNKLIGTFSGTVYTSESASVEFAEGSFDISY